MPFSVSNAENMLVKFGKNLFNEVVYNPQQVAYDAMYGTALVWGLDQTPLPQMISDTVSALPVSEEIQTRITAGAIYSLVKTANTAWDNAMS